MAAIEHLSQHQFGPGPVLGPEDVLPVGKTLPMWVTPAEMRGINSGDHRGITVGQAYPLIANRRYGVENRAARGADSAAEHIQNLTASADRHGGFDSPVLVGIDHKLDEDPLSGVTNTRPVLLDGHHRAAAAIQSNRLLPVEYHQGPAEDAYMNVFSGEHDWNVYHPATSENFR